MSINSFVTPAAWTLFNINNKNNKIKESMKLKINATKEEIKLCGGNEAAAYSSKLNDAVRHKVIKLLQTKLHQYGLCIEASIFPSWGRWYISIATRSFLPGSKITYVQSALILVGTTVSEVIDKFNTLDFLEDAEIAKIAAENKPLYDRYRAYNVINGDNEDVYTVDYDYNTITSTANGNLITNYEVGIKYNDIDLTKLPFFRGYLDSGTSLLESDLDVDAVTERGLAAVTNSDEVDIIENENVLFCCVSKILPVFNMEDKTWSWLKITKEYTEVVWDPTMLEKVVIDPSVKKVIYNLISSVKSRDVDYIANKGNGLIFIYTGPPGVGKTFTAEALGHVKGVPLLKIASGDLGTDAPTIEQLLKKYLDYATAFKAILLIDEADVFMQKRDKDIFINSIVSLFLKTLEYYSGILILTTNLLSTIDNAFRSRIDLIVPFEELSDESKHAVAKGLSRNAGIELPQSTLDWICQLNVNGREIKNIIKLLKMSDDIDDATLRDIFEKQISTKNVV